MSHKLPKSDNKFYEPLTEREQEILRLLAERYRDREIAQKLYLALKTVKWYNSQIYSKLGVNKRTDAVKKAQELGLLDNANQTTIRHNLPTPMTLFIGREQELTDLSKLLNDPNLRLLTLLAPGGMGKTRLALELAHRQLRSYPDGVFLVPLASLSSSEHVTTAIADALDLHIQDEGGLRKQLKRYLHDKKILLILDNFEHLLDATSIVAELLEVASYVKVIATSREKLALSGEKVYSVRGMDFSDWQTPEDALEYDAVRLFIQGAALARSEFEPDAGDYKYLSRICSLTAGMPLALILAAAWVDVLSLEEIAHEIQANVDFLAAEMRDMPRRQWGIRAVFDPTWKRLTTEERAVFMNFSTFRGGCTREAAQTITGATLRHLQTLINKALLTRTAEGRYEIHELLRQYAEEQLQRAGESETAFRRHSEYYADFMQNRETQLKGHGQTDALAEIEADLDNVHVAWDRAIERQDYETVERALECLCWFWFISFRYHEGDNFFHQSLTKIKSPPDESLRLFHAKLISRAEMIRRANLAQFDDPTRTRKRLQTSLSTARQFSNQHEIAFNLMMLGWLEMHISKPVDVYRLLEESLVLFTYLDDSFYAAWVLHFMASARQGSNQARILYKQAINLRRDIGDQMGLMSSMNNLTNVEIGNGNYAEAESLIHEMHKLAEKTRAPGLLTITHGHLGSIYAFQGHLEAARLHTLIALNLSADLNYLNSTIALYSQLAWITCMEEDSHEGKRLCEQAQEHNIKARPYVQFQANWSSALASCDLKDYQMARKYQRLALEFALATQGAGVLTRCLPVVAILAAYADRDAERSTQLLALAFTHPASITGWLDKWALITRLRQDLENELGTEVYNQAWKQGRKLDLMTVVEELVAEYEENQE